MQADSLPAEPQGKPNSPITSWQIDGGKVEIVADFIFLGSKISAESDCSHEIKRHVLLGRKARANINRNIIVSPKSV